MSGGDDWPPEHPHGGSPGAERPWQHPSEVGLAVRGRSDRRRSSLAAAGVVLGGLGLLVSSLALGSLEDDPTRPAGTVPAQRAEQSVAAVMVMDAEGNSSHATAAVIDDEGHLVIDARALEDADTVWARCSGADMQQATLVGRDDASNLAVLRLPVPSGVPASVTPPLSSGDELLVMGAGATLLDEEEWVVSERVADEVSTGSGARLRRFLAEPGPSGSDSPTDLPEPGSMAFDPSGDFAGIVVSSPEGDAVAVASAEDALDRADQLVEDRP